MTFAQDVLAPRPIQSETPPALQIVDTNKVESILETPPTGTGPSDNNPLRWGPIRARPHGNYRFLYGDGIQFQPGNQSKTAVHEISPGVLLELGRHWILDYTARLNFYSNKDFRDTLSHNVSLSGGTTYQDWDLRLSQRYSSTSDPLVETGTQTDQENFTTAINGSYHFNSEVSLDLGLSQNFRSADQFTSSRDWSTMDWLNYQFWPGFSMAVGAGFGYVDVDSGSDMTFEQLQGRMNLRLTGKLSVQVSGGADVRQFLDSSAPTLVNPIFGGSVIYQPFEVTTVSLHADRAVSASYFQSQVTESTDFGASLHQRLLKRFYLDLSGGYRTVKYQSTSTLSAVNREDDYLSFSVRLSTSFLKRGTLAAFYHYSDNSSNQEDFDYLSRQVGFEVGYRY